MVHCDWSKGAIEESLSDASTCGTAAGLTFTRRTLKCAHPFGDDTLVQVRSFIINRSIHRSVRLRRSRYFVRRSIIIFATRRNLSSVRACVRAEKSTVRHLVTPRTRRCAGVGYRSRLSRFPARSLPFTSSPVHRTVRSPARVHYTVLCLK